MSGAAPVIERIFREERTRVLASLVRRLRDFELAEDSLQDALVQAVAAWPRTGVPERPAAWLLTAAINRARDVLRRARVDAAATSEIARSAARVRDPADDDVNAAFGGDDRLRLVFTCCHPAIAQEARVALTLQAVGGLTAREIARAFLTDETAMAQRLVRVKRKIRAAGIPYEVPPTEALRERLDGVRATVYLVFNEGHQATESDGLGRPDLAAEAIRLARLLVELTPDDTESAGLLSLLLTTDARRPARVAADGALVPLDEQDRRRWDRPAIDEGTAILDVALTARRPGPYQIQAAISALHCAAADAASTDWRQIAALYGSLLRHDGSPVVELNRAVALSMTAGPAVGLALLARLASVPAIDGYQPFHAARADLLRRAGRTAESAAAYDRAISLSRNEAERRFLARRRSGLDLGAAGRLA